MARSRVAWPASWRAGPASPGTILSRSPRSRGTEPYVVELILEAGRPVWFCSCPAARDGLLGASAQSRPRSRSRSLTAASTTAPADEAVASSESWAMPPRAERVGAGAPEERAWRRLHFGQPVPSLLTSSASSRLSVPST